MKKKYEEHIEIDQVHLMQTIQLSKERLRVTERKFEESKVEVWKDFFRIECKNYCLLIMLVTFSLGCLAICGMNLTGINPLQVYLLTIFNGAVMGFIVLYDDVKSSLTGMDELLKSVKLNEAKVFAFKSNIYLLLNLACTFILNWVLMNMTQANFMLSILITLIPLYFISGLILLIVDKLHNKISVIMIYMICYLVFAMHVPNMALDSLNPTVGFVLLLGAFGFYCFGIYKHTLCLNGQKGVHLWN